MSQPEQLQVNSVYFELPIRVSLFTINNWSFGGLGQNGKYVGMFSPFPLLVFEQRQIDIIFTS